MRLNKLFYSILLLSFILNYSSYSLGQDKISLSAGFGLLEFANVGVRYQIKQSQIGFSVGIFPDGNDEDIWSILGDVHLLVLNFQVENHGILDLD